ncbi:MAG: tRNA (adenosine(37)-N6)-dimethylallyltransferase MiaA [Oscillospiraceae bacterium]|nr:tRNA (adenosine(37)-N6)-dimethylallyltransferase MiaA [Oscillospiraceae bacterium]
MNNIICIAGPTASGKTALAVEVAKLTNGEVVNCDSMQIYRRMDIGTAKPTLEEMQGIPHHMIDICEPWEDFSVSRYCEMATPIVDDIIARGKTAVIAGGTGLYMDSLIKGNDFAPIPATGQREKLEAQLENEGLEALLRQLQAIDPEAVERAQNNPRRIIRALEVFYETGETITAHNIRTQAVPPRYKPLWIGLDYAERSQLYRRIDLRVENMLQQGLVEEIRDLLDCGIPAKCTAMQAIGYKEFVDALQGKSTISEAAAQVQQSSRRYAKRQLTWLRRNPDMHWIIRREGQSNDEILAAARQLICNFDN